MAVYVMVTSLTNEGRVTVRKSPELVREVNRQVEATGTKVLARYAHLGHTTSLTSRKSRTTRP